MLTKLIAALALCLTLTITPLTASPAKAEGGCEGASWGVACGVGVPGYGGLRRDTVIIHPGRELAFEFDADNPGAWMFHCHNAYHLDAGMTTNFYYER